MYLILFAPEERDFDIPETFLDWAVLDECASITEAGEYIAKEIVADLANGEKYAYRLIETEV